VWVLFPFILRTRAWFLNSNSFGPPVSSDSFPICEQGSETNFRVRNSPRPLKFESRYIFWPERTYWQVQIFCCHSLRILFHNNFKCADGPLNWTELNPFYYTDFSSVQNSGEFHMKISVLFPFILRTRAWFLNSNSLNRRYPSQAIRLGRWSLNQDISRVWLVCLKLLNSNPLTRSL
jgi:hypothetical protein